MKLLNYNRRRFILNSLRTAGGFAIISKQPAFKKFDPLTFHDQYTVQNIIDRILQEGNLSKINDTVDTIKSGDPNQVVTGIVTTMFSTVNVIEEATKLQANFIIAHEPTFYNHRDNKNLVPNNKIVKEKQDLLDKHKIAIWRFHDYCHSLKPDAIMYGVMKKTGWLQYYNSPENVFTIPKTSLQQIVDHLKSSLGITHLRIIGNLQQECKNIAVLPGAPGGQPQMTVAETKQPDVIIVGELAEWETAEYVRDARLMGKEISLIILGHAMSEEPGMEWIAEWLKPIFPAINITHIASGDPFTWI